MPMALAPEITTWPADEPQLIGSGCTSVSPSPPYPGATDDKGDEIVTFAFQPARKAQS